MTQTAGTDERFDPQHTPLRSPREPERPSRRASARVLRREAARLSGWHILIPSALLLIGGVVAITVGSSTTWAAIGQAAITGAIVTGGFGWTEALRDVLQAARDRQIDLGSAAELQHADLAVLTLKGMYLRHANLSGARLSGADARDVDLHGTDLQDARLTEATLRGADLSYANLTGAGCYKADFSNADLRLATLRGAALGEANLTGADLRHTNLSYADLRAANLSGANIDSGTNFEGAWISKQTQFPDSTDRNALPVEERAHRDGIEEPRCHCADLDLRDPPSSSDGS